MRNLTQQESLFIQLLQDNITRMNQNSMQCKTWCIALIAGILAVVATTQNENLIFLAIAITIFSYFLDSSYLRLEKNFRCFEKRLINELKQESVDDTIINHYLFNFDRKELKTLKTEWITRQPIEPQKEVNAESQNWRDALSSWSTFVVYFIIVIMLVGLYFIIEMPVSHCCCN